MLGWSLVYLFIILAFIGWAIVEDDDKGTPVIPSIGVFLFWVFTVFIPFIGAQQKVIEFKAFSSYIEQYDETLSYDGEYVPEKTETMNVWLYNAQARRETYGIFSLYPDEVFDLEPIQ